MRIPVFAAIHPNEAAIPEGRILRSGRLLCMKQMRKEQAGGRKE